MDAQHIIEILIVCLLGLISFIGIRVHSALDRLTERFEMLESEIESRCNEVHKRINKHDLKFARCPTINSSHD